VSAAVAPDPRHDFDTRCGEQRFRYNLRTDVWHWTIWFHAKEPHGLGWFDPGLSVDDNYRCIAGTWLESSEFEEMECGWSTGALSPLIAALSSLDLFRSMGALGIVRVSIAFHILWLCLETVAALYPDPSS
jgi:hypothetical protein